MSQMAGASSTHKHPVASGILPNTYAWKIVVVALLLLVMASWVKGCNERREARADPKQCLNEKTDEWGETPTGYYKGDDGVCVAGTPPPPPAPPAPAVVPVRQRPRTPQTLDIPDEGLRIWLEEAPAIYPKLGPVRVRTPSGRSYVDTPGVDYYPGYEPAGWYTFLPEPAGGKRKVQIYNRW